MKVREEVDALRTIGLDPIDVLVLPRVIALAVTLPLLAFYASVVAIAGGAVMSRILLDIPFSTFMQQFRDTIPVFICGSAWCRRRSLPPSSQWWVAIRGCVSAAARRASGS